MLKITPRKITGLVLFAFTALFALQLFVTKIRVDSFSASQHWLPNLVYWVQEKVLFWDRMDYDRRLRAKPDGKPDPRVAVVAIDEPSLEALGQFPFARSVYAEFLRAAAEAGARVVAFDIVFSEPERNPALKELDDIAAMLRAMKVRNTALDFLAARKAALDSDRILAQALDGTIQVVLGYPFLMPRMGINLGEEIDFAEEILPIPALAKKQVLATDFEFQAIYHGLNPLLPLENLREGKEGVHLGFFNAAVDGDSMIREAALLYRYQDQIYPALAVSAVAAYTQKPFYLTTTRRGLTLAQDGGHSVPLEHAGRVNVNYYGGNRTIPTYEFVDVVNGKIKQEIKDKILFLGVTATGLKDLRGTPFSPDYPGVEVHATIASNILQNNYIRRGSDFALGGFLALLVSVLIVALLAFRFSAWIAVSGFALWIAALELAGQFVFNSGIYIPTLLPMTAAGTMLFVGIMQKYLSSEKEKKFVREAFSRYVSGAVVDEILKDPARLRLGGQKKELTVLFSDMVGFSKLSEHLPADKLTQMLNEYFTRMTKLVLENKGTLDKFIGDAIMCFWGAPLELPNHARLACAAALGMQKELQQLNREWRERYNLEVGMRIGVNTGEMAVGNMGSEQVFNYTVLGDNVNLGSRIEGVNNLFGTRILVGSRTRALAQEYFVFRHVDTVAVKGRETPEEIYELVGEISDAEKHTPWLTVYHRAWDYYKAGQWSEAEAEFQKAGALNPEDKAPQTFLARIQQLKEHSPADWQGVWKLTEK